MDLYMNKISVIKQEETIDSLISNKLTGVNLKNFKRIYYGRDDHDPIVFKRSTYQNAREKNLHIAGYRFQGHKEESRPGNLVRIGLIQNSIVLPTWATIDEQRKAIFEKVLPYIELAALEGVNIVCLQECWSMPFFLCTKEKGNWILFSESAVNGPSVEFLRDIALKHRLVIISPILEKEGDQLWNTAVIINEKGVVIGKSRKNHLPSVGSYAETSYYEPGNLGHPVFDTKFGRIAVNICYGRHQVQNWLMYSLNGAQIVFNPAATVSEFGESFWRIEARNAAIANNYFTCSLNRVGTETFQVGDNGETITKHYYGSSYMSSPEGIMTPALSKTKDGILIGELDLNLCRQAQTKWGFHMTRRMEMYSEEFKKHLVDNKTCNVTSTY